MRKQPPNLDISLDPLYDDAWNEAHQKLTSRMRLEGGLAIGIITIPFLRGPSTSNFWPGLYYCSAFWTLISRFWGSFFSCRMPYAIKTGAWNEGSGVWEISLTIWEGSYSCSPRKPAPGACSTRRRAAVTPTRALAGPVKPRVELVPIEKNSWFKRTDFSKETSLMLPKKKDYHIIPRVRMGGCESMRAGLKLIDELKFRESTKQDSATIAFFFKAGSFSAT